MIFRDFLSYLRDLEVVVMEVHVLLHLIGLCTLSRTFSSLSFTISLKKTTCQRTSWNQADALIHRDIYRLIDFFLEFRHIHTIPASERAVRPEADPQSGYSKLPPQLPGRSCRFPA